MPESGGVVSSEDASSRRVAKVGWGVLLIWTGTVLLLHGGWGVLLIGAGVIVLATQAARMALGLPWERSGGVAGVVLVVCGVWNLFDVSVQLLPLLCIAAGIALLVSTWAAKHRPQASGGNSELPAAPHPKM
jgi:hypothetical protein